LLDDSSDGEPESPSPTQPAAKKNKNQAKKGGKGNDTTADNHPAPIEKVVVRLAVIGQISELSFNFTPVAGWNPNWKGSLTDKSSLTCVIRNPMITQLDMDDDWSTMFQNVTRLAEALPANRRADAHEHFCKNEGAEKGIRISHALFQVSCDACFGNA
jgi:hypothetical protein